MQNDRLQEPKKFWSVLNQTGNPIAIAKGAEVCSDHTTALRTIACPIPTLFNGFKYSAYSA